MKPTFREREKGSAIAALMVAVTLCGALSAAVLLTNSGRSREALTDLDAERAFQMAEAGADWAVAQLRIRNGIVPTTGVTRAINGIGSFQIRYAQGNTNGLDDDGDGVVDNPAESGYASMLSTGTAGRIQRTVQVVMRKAVEIPTFTASVQINVEAPVLDLSGNAFTIDGNEHRLDGTVDASRPAKYAVSSPATVATLASQIPAGRVNRVTGLGANPSVGSTPAMDLNRLVEQAAAAAGTLIAPGTHSNLALGTPTVGGTVIGYCDGDLHLSGNASGAGVLVVDGDLRISGGFQWVGIILVRGRVTMVGGGGGKRLIGALAAGEEAEATTDTTTVGITGTVDMWYSSDAVTLASEAFAIMTIMSWREVANP